MDAVSEGADDFGSMWRGLADAQRQMWTSWAELAATGAQAGARAGAGEAPSAVPTSGGPAGFAGAASPWAGVTDAWLASWRQLAQQTSSAWTAGADPVARDMAQAMTAAQETMMRFGALMQQAMALWSTPGAAGDDAAAKLDAFGKSMQQAVAAPFGAWATAPGGVDDLWTGYLAALRRLPGPWAELLKEVPSSPARAFGGDHSELLGQTRLLWDAWERSAGRLIETPSLGYARESTEMLQRGFEAWIDYRRAVFEFGVVLNEAWAGAGQAAVDMLRRRAAAQTPITSVREFVNAWSEATDGALETAFRSPRYAEAQAAMLAAAMRYRLRERDIVETFLKMTDIPSRSELDETNRRLHALKREVRALRQAVAAGTAAARPAASEGAVKAKPTRRAPKGAAGRSTDKEV